MIASLHQMGTQSVLLTGDNRLTAEFFAKKPEFSRYTLSFCRK